MVLTFLSEKNNQGAIKNAPPSMCRKKITIFFWGARTKVVVRWRFPGKYCY